MTQQEFFKRYKYSIRTDKVGGGAFGTVYKAFDEELNREVAIKVSEVKIMGGKEFSLKDEFDAIKDVPVQRNIANYESLHTFESPQGIFDYAVMQFYKDGNLSSFIKSNPSLAQKEQVALDLLEGIHHLHKHSVVHRDLKPGNILIVKRGDKTIPVITDFGLSKNAKMEGQSRFSNSFGGGTLKYSSPEQLKAEKLRLNTDLWAYGVIVYEIFTGKNLFMAQQITGASAEAEKEIYEQIIGVDVSEMIKELPSKWQEVVKQCLVRDGSKRIKSTQALKDLILKGETFTESAASTNNDKTLISEVVSEESMNAQTIVNDRQTAQKKAVKKEPIPQKEQPKKQVDSKYAKVLQEEKAQKKKMLIGVGIAALLIIAIGIIYIINPFGKNDWEIAQDLNTEQSYRTYIQNNPDGEFIQLAKKKIEWILLDKSSSRQLKSFISNNPESDKKNIILDLLMHIEYDSILTLGSNSSYKYFMDKYPNSVLNDSLKVALGTIEKREWNKVEKKNTIKEYKKFLKEFPKSTYMSLLNKKMSALSWSKKISSTKGKINEASKIIKYSNNKYVLVGSIYNRSDRNNNGYLYMIDDKGNILWKYIFDDYKNNEFRDVALLSDGNLFVVGYADINDKVEMIYQKLTPKGKLIFKKKIPYNDSGFDGNSGSSIVIFKNGFYIAGIGKEKYNKLLLSKFDNNGNRKWTKKYGNEREEYKYSRITLDNNGDVYATGAIIPVSREGYWNTFVLKYDSNGNVIWKKNFKPNSSKYRSSRGKYIDIDKNGYIVVSGSTNSLHRLRQMGSRKNEDANLIKLTKDGKVIFNEAYGYSNFIDWDSATSFINESDGSYLLSGNTQRGRKDNNFWILKVSNKGKKLWQKNYGSTRPESIQSSIKANDGYIFFGTDGDKLWLLKTDKNVDVL